MRLQQSRAPNGVRVVVAALTGLWLLVCGAAGLNHDSQVAHIQDSQGRMMHAASMSGHHDRDRAQSDVHGRRDPDASTGACPFDACFHPQVIRASARALSLELPATELVSCSAPEAPRAAAAAVYREAPKTSPPAA